MWNSSSPAFRSCKLTESRNLNRVMEDLLKIVSAFTEHRLVVALVSLALGKLILDRWSQQRTSRDTRRQKPLEFIEEVSRLLNKALSPTFNAIRKKHESPSKDLSSEMSALFTHRLSVRVRSQGYLKSVEFWRSYEEIILEHRDLIKSLVAAAQQHRAAEIETLAIQRRKLLLEKWNLSDTCPEKLEEPYQSLARWNSALFGRAHQLLSEALSGALEGKKIGRTP